MFGIYVKSLHTFAGIFTDCYRFETREQAQARIDSYWSHLSPEQKKQGLEIRELPERYL